MCIAMNGLKGLLPGDQKAEDEKQKADLKATDVPLGDGMVGQARLSILNRREQIRRGVEGGL